jgi:hypothetical protein
MRYSSALLATAFASLILAPSVLAHPQEPQAAVAPAAVNLPQAVAGVPSEQPVVGVKDNAEGTAAAEAALQAEQQSEQLAAQAKTPAQEKAEPAAQEQGAKSAQAETPEPKPEAKTDSTEAQPADANPAAGGADAKPKPKAPATGAAAPPQAAPAGNSKPAGNAAPAPEAQKPVEAKPAGDRQSLQAQLIAALKEAGQHMDDHPEIRFPTDKQKAQDAREAAKLPKPDSSAHFAQKYKMVPMKGSKPPPPAKKQEPKKAPAPAQTPNSAPAAPAQEAPVAEAQQPIETRDEADEASPAHPEAKPNVSRTRPKRPHPHGWRKQGHPGPRPHVENKLRSKLSRRSPSHSFDGTGSRPGFQARTFMPMRRDLSGAPLRRRAGADLLRQEFLSMQQQQGGRIVSPQVRKNGALAKAASARKAAPVSHAAVSELDDAHAVLAHLRRRSRGVGRFSDFYDGAMDMGALAHMDRMKPSVGGIGGSGGPKANVGGIGGSGSPFQLHASGEQDENEHHAGPRERLHRLVGGIGGSGAPTPNVGGIGGSGASAKHHVREEAVHEMMMRREAEAEAEEWERRHELMRREAGAEAEADAEIMQYLKELLAR